MNSAFRPPKFGGHGTTRDHKPLHTMIAPIYHPSLRQRTCPLVIILSKSEEKLMFNWCLDQNCSMMLGKYMQRGCIGVTWKPRCCYGLGMDSPIGGAPTTQPRRARNWLCTKGNTWNLPKLGTEDSDPKTSRCGAKLSQWNKFHDVRDNHWWARCNKMENLVENLVYQSEWSTEI